MSGDKVREGTITCCACEFEAECEEEFLSDDWTFCPRSGMPIAVMKGYDPDQETIGINVTDKPLAGRSPDSRP